VIQQKQLNRELLMAIIQKLNLFSWTNFHNDSQNLGDLERLKLVIETMPDEKLMQTLHFLRANGRNDHPIEAVWNSILAGIVFDHVSIQSLRRELNRNAQLRELCGLNPLLGNRAVPSKSAYNRFISNLLRYEPLIRNMFDDLVAELQRLCPGFGINLAGDGKAIQSFGKPCKKQDGDQRRDEDADWGVKKYCGIGQDGKAWEKIKSWFGFRLHLIADADVELPVAYKITKASVGEQPMMRDMINELAITHPELINHCEHALFDKGYDSTDNICQLWDKYKIKPIIDIRNCWPDQETKLLKNTKIKNITYNYQGTVFCHCPETGEVREMTYNGFENRRNTLKYTCPALAKGIQCKGAEQCSQYLKSVRIPLDEDRRIFTPVARSSYKWETLYDKRTSIERINSRIDGSFGFERHYIRGLQKMTIRCGLALCIMLAIAVGRLRQNRPDLVRSIVKTA